MNKTIKSFSILACLSLMMLLGSCEQKATPSQENLQEKSAFDALQQEFSERVKFSTITEQSKQTIMNATATGLNSIALWEQK